MRPLKSYLRLLQSTNVKSLDRGEQFAFWVNLYNAKTIDVILSKYPVSSIKKIKSRNFFPWPVEAEKHEGQWRDTDA